MIVEKEMNNVDKKQNKEFLDFIYYFIEKIIKYYNNYVFVKKYFMDSRYYQISNYDHLLISKYIDRCQSSNVDDLEYEFKKFKDNLLISTDNKKRYFKFNHGFLLRSILNEKYYYILVLYEDIDKIKAFEKFNRRVLQMYAYLNRCFDIIKNDNLEPIIFYVSNKKMYGNIYLPEETNIYRGKRFFDEFLNVKYDDLDKFLNGFSEDDETIKKFDKLYNGIMNLR